MSVLRENVQWREPEPPFCARRLLVNPNDRTINEHILEVGVIAHDVEKTGVERTGAEKTLENASLGPSAKTTELAIPIPKM